MQARRRHAARAATGWGPRPLGRGFAADARAWLHTRTATRQPTQQRKRRVRKPQLESSAGATPRARQARLQRTATNASLFRPAPLLLLLIHKRHGRMRKSSATRLGTYRCHYHYHSTTLLSTAQAALHCITHYLRSGLRELRTAREARELSTSTSLRAA